MDVADINRAIGSGNEAAWRAIYPDAFMWLCGYIRKASSFRLSHEEIQGMAQGVLLKILVKNPPPTFASVGRFRAYLQTAAGNGYKDRAKVAEITERGTQVGDGDLDGDLELVADLGDFVEENNLANVEEIDADENDPDAKSKLTLVADQALKRLAPDEQHLVKERLNGVPFPTLANELGEKAANLKMRHKRALEKLKKYFIEIAHEHNYENKSLRLPEPRQQ